MSGENKVVTEEISEREEQQDLLNMEDDILRGLIEAAQEQVNEVATIEIVRNKKVYFKFRIRGLTEEEYNKCREEATNYTFSRRLGVKLPQDLRMTYFRSLLIFKATVDEDRKRVWENKQAWERLGVLSGPELIDKVLLAGEKAAIIDKIDELSGFKDEEDQTRVDELKN